MYWRKQKINISQDFLILGHSVCSFIHLQQLRMFVTCICYLFLGTLFRHNSPFWLCWSTLIEGKNKQYLLYFFFHSQFYNFSISYYFQISLHCALWDCTFTLFRIKCSNTYIITLKFLIETQHKFSKNIRSYIVF